MNQNKSRIIAGNPSIFLDSLRISAALTVLFVHAHDQWFPSQENPSSLFGRTAHAAVIVFFVLSGYVIAHTTTNNHGNGTQYFHKRLTRLWSVVLPALLITGLIQLIVQHNNPVLIVKYARGLSWPRYIISGCFLNEIWFFSSPPPINVPIWSLGYEFWYYVIFGLWFYRRLGWKAFLPIVFACLLAGPNILLMFPIWLAGCIVYRLPGPKISAWQAWALIFTAFVLFCVCIVKLPLMPNAVGPKPFLWAGQFISDWIESIFIAFALWILPAGSAFKGQLKLTTLFRKFADLMFPIYVLHYPLLVLYHTVFVFRANSIFQFCEAVFTVFLVSSVIGIFLEKRRMYFSLFFKWFLRLVKNAYLRLNDSKNVVLNGTEVL